MLKVLISLVFLFLIQIIKPIYAENIAQLLPKQKPKTILNFSKKTSDLILPQKKPSLIKNKNLKKNIVLPKIKPINKQLDKIIIK